MIYLQYYETGVINNIKEQCLREPNMFDTKIPQEQSRLRLTVIYNLDIFWLNNGDFNLK